MTSDVIVKSSGHFAVFDHDEYSLLLENLPSSFMTPLTPGFPPNSLTSFKTPLTHSFFSAYILFHRISSVALFSFHFTEFFFSDPHPKARYCI